MARISEIFRWLGVICIWGLVAGSGHAQTNALPPWLGHDRPAKTLHPPPATNAAPELIAVADAERFFAKYEEAVILVAKNKHQDAGILMDLVSRNLSTSPWLELAVLKHAQLIERTNDKVAEQNYTLLDQRIANAPYFQGDGKRAKLFATALQGTIHNGINRLRLRRVADGLGRYFGRYGEYPESLPKLAILGYTDMQNIHAAANKQLFRYQPQMPKMKPFISYQRYDLEPIISEPFYTDSPKLEGTTQVSENPLQYAALIQVPGKRESVRVVENQTLAGLHVAVVAHDGVVLCDANHIVVLIAPR